MVLSLVGRRLLRKRLSRLRSQGECLQRTVVIGRADSAADLIAQIQNAPGSRHGGRGARACPTSTPGGPSRRTWRGVPVFGFPEEALSAVDLFDAEVVAVTSHPDLVGHSLRRLAWSLEERKVDLVVSPGILEVAGPRLSIRPAAGMPLLHVERPVMAGSRRVVKSLVDKVLTLGLILAALPALLLVGLLVLRLDSSGPVFFRQKRVGAQGEEFDMLKFRTMVVDAEERLAELAAQHDGNAVLFKMKDDPRVTRIGKVLRRYSVDELPQLVNVLKGQMSLVGPRPPLPREVAGYEPDAIRRLGSARPHRPVAGQRPQRPLLGGVAAPRPLVRRQLVARARPANSRPHGTCGPSWIWSLLMSLTNRVALVALPLLLTASLAGCGSAVSASGAVAPSPAAPRATTDAGSDDQRRR